MVLIIALQIIVDDLGHFNGKIYIIMILKSGEYVL